MTLTATLANYNTINLSWSASTDDYALAGYLVYRNNVALNTVSSLITSTSYSDIGLAENTVYSYYVKAVDASKAKNISAASPSSTKTTDLNPAGDFNNNGVSNAIEQALGLDPKVPNDTNGSNAAVKLNVHTPISR